MKVSITIVFVLLSVITLAHADGNTINFNFANMLGGANGGSCGGDNSNCITEAQALSYATADTAAFQAAKTPEAIAQYFDTWTCDDYQSNYFFANASQNLLGLSRAEDLAGSIGFLSNPLPVTTVQSHTATILSCKSFLYTCVNTYQGSVAYTATIYYEYSVEDAHWQEHAYNEFDVTSV